MDFSAGSTSDQSTHKRCSHCGRSFARTEHLIRHQRTHTNDKPFRCQLCDATFSRKDVLVKHGRNTHSGNQDGPNDDIGNDLTPKHKGKRKRARIACESCRQKKLRCISSHHSREPNASLALGAPTLNHSFLPLNGTETPSQAAPISDAEWSQLPNEPGQFGEDALENQTFEFSNTDPDLWTWLDEQDFANWDIGSVFDKPFDTLHASSGVMIPASVDSPLPDNIQAALLMLPPSKRHQSSDQLNQDNRPHRWSSEQPDLARYDPGVVNVFINLAVKNLGSTFHSLRGFVVSPETRAELYMAVAAVGGLFCRVAGSYQVAESMHHDSRRLLHNAWFNHRPTDRGSCWNMALSLITLEIYGLCSGDKRSYEFVEVFHTDAVEALMRYLESLPATDRHNDSLCQSMLVLECYRTMLLQVPTRLPAHLIHTLVDRAGARSLLNGDLPSHGAPQEPDYENRSSLALIALMVPRFIPDKDGISSEDVLWRSDFVHLGLHRLGAKQSFDIADLFLYHMLHISLYIDMTLLQCFARSSASLDDETPNSRMVERMRVWNRGKHGMIAHWHATRIVLAAQALLSGDPDIRHGMRDQTTGLEKSAMSLLGAPHIPYCIYYATIVSWSAARLSGGSNVERELLLRTGSMVLTSLPARVARTLANALSEVET